ncbi:AsnC family protein [Rhodopila sp.]|uniref:AsnC family protein n=1 Tax=Rhodopila sp. TaxID=2480087 RepID=UPI003D0E0097
MPRKIVWTEGQDTQIRRLRTEGASWDVIAQVLGLARCTLIERARILGVEQPPAHAAAALDESDRAPLPAGHAESWAAINRGTSLEDARFQTPDAIR